MQRKAQTLMSYMLQGKIPIFTLVLDSRASRWACAASRRSSLSLCRCLLRAAIRACLVSPATSYPNSTISPFPNHESDMINPETAQIYLQYEDRTTMRCRLIMHS